MGKNLQNISIFDILPVEILRIQFSSGNSTDPEGMLEDLITYINNEDVKSEDECKIFLVIDTDLNEKRINKIK